MENTVLNSIQSPQRRYDWIDGNKGLAIVIVVLYHVTIGLQKAGILPLGDMLEYAWIAMTALATPVFFIMSGYFVERSIAKHGVGIFFKTSAQYILYPFFFWSIFQLAVKIIFSRFVNTQEEGINFIGLLITPPDQFWFLHALFLAQVMFILFYKFFPKHHLLMAGIAFLSSWLLLDVSTIADAVRAFGFLLFGAWMAKQKDLPDIIRSSGIMAISLFIYIFSLVLYKEVMAPLGFNGMTNFIGGVAITFVISAVFMRYSTPRWLTVCGQYSMYIFVLHIMCLVPVRVVYNMLGMDSVSLLIMVSTLAGIILPIIAAVIIEFMGIEKFLGIKRVSAHQKRSFADHNAVKMGSS